MAERTYQEVADYFIALGNASHDNVTNLRLQKLVYYAQAWHLANRWGPLFDADFQAWVHGPVIPGLYRKYSHLGAQPILAEGADTASDVELQQSLDAALSVFDEPTQGLLEMVADAYMGLGAWALERLTHQERPWVEAREGLEPSERCTTRISRRTMRDFYGEQIEE